MSNQPTPAPKVCPVCGKPTKLTYCSNLCSGKARHKGETRSCLYCQGAFYIRRAYLRKGGGAYCSRSCRYRHKAEVGTAYPKKGILSVHRLVAAAALGRPLRPGEVVHHKDNDRKNFAPENLKVLPSQTEHMRHHAKRGQDSNFAKLTWPVVREIRRRRSAGESAASLAKEFHVDPSNIRLIVRGRTWKERTLFDGLEAP